MHLKLIVDAGSTKTNWYFIDELNEITLESTDGINPSTSVIQESTLFTDDLIKLLKHTTQVHYYGAGVIDNKSTDAIKAIFQPFIINHIEFHSDLLAAARATLGINKGVISILGTGSNTGYYDGNELHGLNPALGYILGDDGGGSNIGKRLLRAYFYNQMPDDVHNEFQKKYNISKSNVIKELHTSRQPARYLGQFSQFLNLNKEEWQINFIKNIFREFVDLHLKNFQQAKIYPLCFVGSIAFYFKKELIEVCEENGLTVGKILKAPALSLIDYHKKYNE